MRLRRGRRAVERIDDAGTADQRVLDHLVALGCDLAQPRETRHFLYVADRDAADDVAEQLRRDGWEATVDASESGWLVLGTRVGPLTLDVVRETRALLESLASGHGGLYDGWEASAS